MAFVASGVSSGAKPRMYSDLQSAVCSVDTTLISRRCTRTSQTAVVDLTESTLENRYCSLLHLLATATTQKQKLRKGTHAHASCSEEGDDGVHGGALFPGKSLQQHGNLDGPTNIGNTVPPAMCRVPHLVHRGDGGVLLRRERRRRLNKAAGARGRLEARPHEKIWYHVGALLISLR